MNGHAHDRPSVLHRSGRHAEGPSPIDRIDPRARILAAVAFSVVVVLVARHFSTLAVALCLGVAVVVLARPSASAVLRRLVPLNLFVLLLAVVLPLGTPGTPLFVVGPVGFSREGFWLAAEIALKGNAILLVLLGLLGTLDVTVLGHAMNHLYVPDKLTHLLLLTVRYLDVLHREHLRLAAAMKVRGFRPRMSRHTYRTYGYLVGMLLVRSFDRAERVLAAMKCRGFRGHFYLLDHFAFSRRDVPFCVLSAAAMLGLVALELLVV